MLNNVNAEKIKEIIQINKDQNKLIKYVLNGQKVKKEIRNALKDTINNTDDIFGLDNLSINRTLFYNTIPTTKNKNEETLTEYEDIYIDILKIIKKYINDHEYSFMFNDNYSDVSIYSVIHNLSGIMTRFSFEDLKHILKNINESNGIRINKTKTYLKLINCVSIKDKDIISELIMNINSIKEENKQILVYKTLKIFYEFNVDEKFKNYIFRLLEIIKNGNDDITFNIIDKFLDIIYNNGYLSKNSNFNRYFFVDILETINKDYNNKNIESYLDLLKEKDIILSNYLELEDKEFILKLVLNRKINSSCIENMIKYIKTIITCEDKKLKNYLIDKIEHIKYNKAYEWLIEFYPIIVRYGNIIKKQELIDELSYMNDDNIEQEKFCKVLNIPIEYTKDDLN